MERSLRHNESIRVRLAAPAFSRPDTRLSPLLEELFTRENANDRSPTNSTTKGARDRDDGQAAKCGNLRAVDRHDSNVRSRVLNPHERGN